MKMLIVLLRLKGGVGRANVEIAEVLRKKDWEVDFLSREDDLKIFSLLKSFFTLKKRVKELMKKRNYDIIYTQDYSCALPLLFPFPIFWKKHFCCFCGVKSGKHPELIQWHHKFFQRLVGKIMGKKIVVIGDQLKEIFPKSKLIYRGVNINKFKPLQKKRDCLGWINKDIEKISRDELQKICENTGLKLFVAENIPVEKMNEFYNKCQVFIDLPRTAGFNLAWLEAMAAGVPIILGNEKGAGTILPFDKILKDKEKIKEIEKKIKNPKCIDYRKWVIDNEFTWEDKAKKLIKFFKEKNMKYLKKYPYKR